MTPGAPRGYSSISPLLAVKDVEQELEFIKGAFGAEIAERQRGKQGELVSAGAKIGDTVVMFETRPGGHAVPAGSLLLWSDNVDTSYRQALQCGAITVSEPTQQGDGRRVAVVKDPQGITWRLTQERSKMSTKEVEHRLAEQRKSRM